MKKTNLPTAATVAGGIGLLGLSLFLWSSFLHVRSRDSVVEVKTLSIKSPIAGVITDLNLVAGDTVKDGEPLFEVRNPVIPKPRVSDLKIQLSTLESELQVLLQGDKRNSLLLTEATVDQRNQIRLQVRKQTEELLSLEKAKVQAIQEAAFAKREYQRKKVLYEQGAYAFDLVDRAETTMRKANQEVSAAQNRIQAQKQVLEAAKKNLTLIATRGGSDPEARLRDITTQSLKTEEEISSHRNMISYLKTQIASAQQEYFRSAMATPTSPINGVVWKVDLQSGSGVKEQENVLHLLDCNTRWVNSYVKEGDLKRIRIGQEAEVELFGSREKLSGKVSLIRSGIGRTTDGRDFLKLLPINIYRESQVRVDIHPTTDIREESKNMCYAGYTGKVTFL
ncbi:multidrug resistance efflux pump membrane protein [Synechococcus phage S-CBWM1]|uniref:Multidrug resistance efflux pump membrane protein n=1 Tax=Synechococcus phage S-CBWM1 TaxID=2053653 RepID=A0A3G1L3S9_9CAUD|nr:multidrug resistance efflux pump membrane protein [Synechococcus phage S-CBWM1]ATW62841.1 multidrug resistance efflux pump membrane protein [Synechococcus phage S-CBWM1]